MRRGPAHAASLPRDLDSLLRQAQRRDVLRLLGAASLLPLLGCGTGVDALGSTSTAEETAASSLHQLCGSERAFRASSGLIGSRPTSRAIRTAFSTSGPLPFAISVPAASK